MPGTLNVGGHNIITHSGTSGAGDVTVNVQDRLVLDSSGNVGIGTDSPIDKLDLRGNIAQIDPSPAHFFATTNSSHFNWKIAAQESTNEAFEISSGTQVAGTSATTDTYTPRLVIDSSGNLLVGTTSITVGGGGSGVKGFRVDGDNGIVQAAAIGNVSAVFNRTSSQGNIVHYRYNGTTIGSISTNTYSLPSDRDFKKDINDLNLGLELVKKLKPKSYRYNIDDDNSPYMTGLVAQDLEESLAEVGVAQNESWILQYNENVDEGNSKYELDYSKLIPVLTKAIQEQQTIIESQQTQIDALTARIEALENA